MLNQQRTIARSLVELQRTTFTGIMRNYITLMGQRRSIYDTCMNQAFWIPEQGKKAFRGLFDRNKRALEDYTEFVSSAYEGIQEFFAAGESR